MARTPATFKKTDIVRLVEAARAAGLKVAGVEVTPDGTLRAVEVVCPQQSVSEFDRWEAEL